jgi:hypothetical protein
VGVALVALAVVIAFGVGLPVLSLLIPPPGIPAPPAAPAGGGPDSTDVDVPGGGFQIPPAADQVPGGNAPGGGAPGGGAPGGNAAPDGNAGPAGPAAGMPAAQAAAPAPAGEPAPAPQPAPKPAPLAATYSTVAQIGPLGLIGYQGQVTIHNPSQVTISGWTVRFQLPVGELVTGASGAGYRQDGTSVTFTPSGTGTVPAGGSVRFTFTVTGVNGAVIGGPPTGCTIDGRPCG